MGIKAPISICTGKRLKLTCPNENNKALASRLLKMASRQPNIKVAAVIPSMCRSRPVKIPALIRHSSANTSAQANTPVCLADVL